MVSGMERNELTKENLVNKVKDILGTAPESIMVVLVNILENEGSSAVIQYLNNLQRACQDRGFDPYPDEYMRDIIQDSLIITGFCCRREYPLSV